MKIQRQRLSISVLALAMLLGACSNNHKSNDSSERNFGTETDFLVHADDDLFFDDQFSFELDDIANEESVVASQSPLIFDDHEHSYESHSEDLGHLSDEFSTYTFKAGDTLMWVAFSIYGDYRKWKELKEWNSHVNTNQLGAGSVIRYKAPAHKFVWQPEGLPHLVKRGETLGTISSDKYGTARRWKDIYHNNKPLIRDPNLIFAGFTLYYVPDQMSDRGIATHN
jgi:nucleoid-associated protein YgaU